MDYAEKTVLFFWGVGAGCVGTSILLLLAAAGLA